MTEDTPTPTPTGEIQAPTPTPAGSGGYPGPQEPSGYPAPEAQAAPTAGQQEPAYPSPVDAPAPQPAYPGPGEEPVQDSPYPGPATLPTPHSGTGAYPVPGERTPAPAAVTSTATPSPRQESPIITGEPVERTPGGPMPTPSPGGGTISIWHSWSSTQVQVLEPAMRAFQSVYPDVFFDATYFPGDDLQRRYEAAVYLGGGPSLVFGPSEWGPSFYEQNLVVDISDLAVEEFLSRINPAAVEQGQVGEALVSLPYSIRQGVVMYRNKQIIPSAPGTFDELVRVARAATKGGVVGAYLERSYFYSAAHLNGLGGALMNADGSPAFNTSQGVEWLRLLHSFTQAGPFEFNGNRDLDTFIAGKAGIIIDGSWNRTILANAIGAENLAIDPWPSHQNGQLSGFIRTDNVYLNANLVEHERYYSLLFMAFMLTPEVQSMLSHSGFIPVVSDARLDDAHLQQMVNAFEGAVSYPVHRYIPVYWDPLEAAMLKVFNGSAAPSQALAAAEAEVKAALRNLAP
jgi:arabinogalactan oligomer / maltooligosaccharide transport system substrate-binding protein